MTVAWRGPGRARERMLVYGPPKVGKSTAALDVVKKVGGGARAWVVDCDNAWGRMLEDERAAGVGVVEEWEGKERVADWEDPDGNVVLIRVKNWVEFTRAMKRWDKEAGRDDWLVVDSMTHPWSWVQEWYIEQVYGEDMPDFLIQHRMDQIKKKEESDGGSGAMLVEWVYLNRVWNEGFANIMVNARSHVLLVAEAKGLHFREGKQTREMFDAFGYKPSTQSRLAYQVSTVLLLDKNGKGAGVGHTVTTVGDRGRENTMAFDGEMWDDFFEVYLKGAGWKKKKV